jgi:hypothetical protein
MSSNDRRPFASSVSFSLLAGLGALAAGIGLDCGVVFLRDAGPAWNGISLRGNGAVARLPLALLFLMVGEVLCARRRAWIGILLVPVALIAGVFVVVGGI